MGEVTDDRFCPICEQIVPREQEGVLVKISPARTILLHDGCAKRVQDSMMALRREKKIKHLEKRRKLHPSMMDEEGRRIPPHLRGKKERRIPIHPKDKKE